MRLKISIGTQGLLLLLALAMVPFDQFALFLLLIPLGILQLLAAVVGLLTRNNLREDAVQRLYGYWIAVFIWGLSGFLVLASRPPLGLDLIWIPAIPLGLAAFYFAHEVMIYKSKHRRRGKFLPNLQF